MENSIFDFFVASAIAAYWNTRAAEQGLPPYLGEELFPAQKKRGLDLKWIKGAKGIPTVLNLSAFDANVIKKDRIGFSSVQTKMPFFKNSLMIDEELRQELLIMIETGNQAMIDMVLNNIFNDTVRLLEDASVTRERMRMQLISTGTVVMANNGQEYTYDYQLPADQKVTPATLWSTPTADVLADIQAWQDVMVNKGYAKPTRAVTSTAVLRNLAKNETIRNAIYVLGQGLVTPNEAQVLNYIFDNTGLRIVAYDKVYGDEDGVTQRFIPEDLFIMLPEGNIGYTWFGTTPEEADLMGSMATAAQVSLVDTGVAVTTTNRTDPVNVETKVSQICLPSGENIDQIVIADVI